MASCRIILFLLLILSFGCQNQERASVPVKELSGQVFGSSYSIKYTGDLDPQKWQIELDSFFKSFNSEFSTYQNDSVISQFNHSPANRRMKVTRRFIEMLKLAKSYHGMTDGAFDPTIGPVIEAWGFTGKKRTHAPSKKEIEVALSKVGIHNFKWDEKSLEVWKLKGTVSLNVNAFAPGWAADLIGEELSKKNIHNYMVDIGGEILVKGKKGPDSWIIGIEEPSQDLNHKLTMAVKITDLSISTSGDYRQFFTQDGKRRSHIIDPRTGYPVSHQISSVTVLTQSAAEADALGTALMVLGESGLTLLEKKGIPALLLKAETPGKFSKILTKDMRDYLKVNQL